MARKEKGICREGWTALLIVAALGARLVYLLRKPLWFDEIFTLWISRKPARELIGALRSDSGPPLFYLLEKPFVALAESLHADQASRAIPFLAAAALFGLNGRRRFSAGAQFPLLVAACPLLFFYSGEARVYAPLALASFCLFLAAFRSRTGARSLWSAAALSVILPMLHYLGGLVLAGSAVLCAIRGRWRMLAAQVLGGSVFLLWLPTALAQPPQAIGWAADTPAASAQAFFQKVGFWGSYPAYFTSAHTPAPAAGAALGLGLLAGALWAARKDRRIQDSLAFALLPLLFALLVGLRIPIFFSGRTEMGTLPVLLWTFARSARRLARMRAVAGIASAAGAVVILLALTRPPRPGPYFATARFLSEISRTSDVILATDSNYLPLALASDRGELRGRVMGIPAELESHPGWFLTSPDFSPGEIDRALRAVAGPVRRGYLALTIPPDPALRAISLRLMKQGRPLLLRVPGGYPVLEVSR